MQLLHDPAITTVILHARWAREFWGTPYQGELGVKPLEIFSAGQHGNGEALAEGVQSAIEQLTRLGKQVYIVAGVPEIGIDVPNFLSRAQYLHRDVSIKASLSDYIDRNGDINLMLANIVRQRGATILYIHTQFCATQSHAKPALATNRYIMTTIISADMVPCC